MTLGRLVAGCGVWLALLCASAEAAGVRYTIYGSSRSTVIRLDYTAGAGEANRVRFTADRGGVLVADAGVLLIDTDPLASGQACYPAGVGRAWCSLMPTAMQVTLGDRDDSAEAGLDVSTRFDDGAGDDVLTGAGGWDTFVAGPGADRYDGGGGTDRITYEHRGGGVEVSFDGVANDGAPGEGDAIASVESASGSQGDDVLTGSPGDDALFGAGGHDRITGHHGRDELNGGPGDDEVRGGAGDDSVADGEGADLVDGGAGSDWLLAGTGGDRVHARDGQTDYGLLCPETLAFFQADEADTFTCLGA